MSGGLYDDHHHGHKIVCCFSFTSRLDVGLNHRRQEDKEWIGSSLEEEHINLSEIRVLKDERERES